MIDPRMADRRKAVLERGARKGLRRAIILLVIVSLLAGVVWLLQSSYLSVHEIEVSGSDRPDVFEAILSAGIEEGIPLILVRTGEAVDELEELAWIRAAEVRRVFPDRVEVAVDQRHAVVWMWDSGSYAVLDFEGVVLEYVTSVVVGTPVLQLGIPHVAEGEAHTDPAVLGGVEFIAALGGVLSGVEVRQEGGELIGRFAGHDIRLGRPVDMVAKAAALLAVLADGLPEGSSINLIAPARPAVTP
jgi:cell division septal protein FtsQ